MACISYLHILLWWLLDHFELRRPVIPTFGRFLGETDGRQTEQVAQWYLVASSLALWVVFRSCTIVLGAGSTHEYESASKSGT